MLTIKGLEPTFTTFPDGEFNVNISKSVIDILEADENIEVVWKFESNDEIMKLGILLDLMSTYLEKGTVVKVKIPFLPYSRMDRYEKNTHNSFSLKVFESILRGIKNGSSLDIRYLTESVHNPEALDKNLIENKEIITELITKYFAENKHLNQFKTLIVFPDKGALRRYVNDTVNIFKNPEIPENYTVGVKKRDFSTHKITSYEISETTTMRYDSNTEEFVVTDAENFNEIFDNVIVIDDVISYGNTFIRLFKALEKIGFKNYALITSHAEDAAWRGDLFAQLPHNTTFITTSSLNKHQLNRKNV